MFNLTMLTHDGGCKESGSFLWCPLPGQKQLRQIGIQEDLSDQQKRFLWVTTLILIAQRLWSSPPWRSSKAACAWSWAPCWAGVGLDGSLDGALSPANLSHLSSARNEPQVLRITLNSISKGPAQEEGQSLKAEEQVLPSHSTLEKHLSSQLSVVWVVVWQASSKRVSEKRHTFLSYSER